MDIVAFWLISLHTWMDWIWSCRAKTIQSVNRWQLSAAFRGNLKCSCKETMHTSQQWRNRFGEMSEGSQRKSHSTSGGQMLGLFKCSWLISKQMWPWKSSLGELNLPFWLQMVSETAFPHLRKVALHISTMFGSTYSCEAAFSTMNIIKTKYRSRLTNEHLHMCMRTGLTPFQPRFTILAN